MSAQAITKSQEKLAVWAEARERDRRAVQIMERDGCSFSEAYLRVLNLCPKDFPCIVKPNQAQ